MVKVQLGDLPVAKVKNGEADSLDFFVCKLALVEVESSQVIVLSVLDVRAQQQQALARRHCVSIACLLLFISVFIIFFVFLFGNSAFEKLVLKIELVLFLVQFFLFAVFAFLVLFHKQFFLFIEVLQDVV